MVNYNIFLLLLFTSFIVLYLLCKTSNYNIERFIGNTDGIDIPNGGIYKKILNNKFYTNVVLETNAKEELFIFLGKVNEQNNYIKNILNASDFLNDPENPYPIPSVNGKNIGYEISLCEKNISNNKIEHYYNGFIYYVRIKDKPIAAFSKYNSMILGSDNNNSLHEILSFEKYRTIKISKIGNSDNTAGNGEYYMVTPVNEKYDGYENDKAYSTYQSPISINKIDNLNKSIFYLLLPPVSTLSLKKDFSINSIPIVREIKNNIENPSKLLTTTPNDLHTMNSIIHEDQIFKCLDIYGYIPKKINNYPYVLSAINSNSCSLENSNFTCAKLKFIATLKPNFPYFITDKKKDEDTHNRTLNNYKLGLIKLLTLFNEDYKLVYLRNGLDFNTKINDGNQTYGIDDNNELDAVYTETIKAYKFKQTYDTDKNNRFVNTIVDDDKIIDFQQSGTYNNEETINDDVEKVYYTRTSKYSLKAPKCPLDRKEILIKSCIDESCGSKVTETLTNCKDVENVNDYKNYEHHIEECINRTIEYTINVPITGYDLKHYDENKLSILSRKLKKDFNYWLKTMVDDLSNNYHDLLYMFFDKEGLDSVEIINVKDYKNKKEIDINYNIIPVNFFRIHIKEEYYKPNNLYVNVSSPVNQIVSDDDKLNTFIEIDLDTVNKCIKVYTSKTYDTSTKKLKDKLLVLTYGIFEKNYMSTLLYPEISVAYKGNINDTYYNYFNKNKELPLERVSGVKVKILKINTNNERIIPNNFEYLGGDQCEAETLNKTNELYGSFSYNECFDKCDDDCIGVSITSRIYNKSSSINSCKTHIYNNKDASIKNTKKTPESHLNTHCYKKINTINYDNKEEREKKLYNLELHRLKKDLYWTYGKRINNILHDNIIDISIDYPENEFNGCYIENSKLKCDKKANDYIFINLVNKYNNALYTCYNHLNACNLFLNILKPVKTITRKNNINDAIEDMKKHIGPFILNQQIQYGYYIDDESKVYIAYWGGLNWWNNTILLDENNKFIDKIYDNNLNGKDFKILMFDYYKMFNCSNYCTINNVNNINSYKNITLEIYDKYINAIKTSNILKESKCIMPQLVKTSLSKNNSNFVKIFANQNKNDVYYKFFISGVSTSYIFLGKINNDSVKLTKRNNVNVMPNNSNGIQVTLDALMGANDKYGTYAIEVNGSTHKPISKFTKKNGDIVDTRILTGPESDDYALSMPKPRSLNGSKPSLLGLDINYDIYDNKGKMLDVRKYDVTNGIAGKYQTIYLHISGNYLYILYFSSINPNLNDITVDNIIMTIDIKDLDLLNDPFNVYICSDTGFSDSLAFLTNLKMIVPSTPVSTKSYDDINDIVTDALDKLKNSLYKEWYEIVDTKILLKPYNVEKILVIFNNNNDGFLKMLLNHHKCSGKRYDFPIYCFEYGVYNFLFYNVNEYNELSKNLTMPSKIIKITENEMKKQIKIRLKDENISLCTFDHSLLNIDGDIIYTVSYYLDNNALLSKLNKTFNVYNRTETIKDGNKSIKILYYDYNNIYNYWYVDKFTSIDEPLDDCFENINTFNQNEQFNDDNIKETPENFTFRGRGSCMTENNESPANLVVPLSINPKTFKPLDKNSSWEDAYNACSLYCLPLLEGGVAKTNDCIGFNTYKISDKGKYNCNIYLNASAYELQKNRKYLDLADKYSLYRRIKQGKTSCSKDGVCGPIEKVKKICEDFPQGCDEFYNNKIEEMGYACFSRDNAKIYKNKEEYNSTLIDHNASVIEKQKKEMLEQMTHLVSLGMPVVYQQVKNLNDDVMKNDPSYKPSIEVDFLSSFPIYVPEQKKEEPINIDPLPECKGAFHNSYNECICPDDKPIMYELKYNNDGTAIKGDKKFHCVKNLPPMCGISEDVNMKPLSNVTNFVYDPSCECPINRMKTFDNGVFWCDMRRYLDKIDWSECSPYEHDPYNGNRFKSTDIKFMNQGNGERCINTYMGRNVKLKTEDCTPTNLDFDYWLKANLDVGCSTSWFSKDDNYVWNTYKNGVEYYKDNKDNDFSYQKLINNANNIKSQKSGACHMKWRGDYGKCVAEWEMGGKEENYYTCQTDTNQCIIKKINNKQVLLDPKYIDTTFKTESECLAKCDNIHTAMNNNFTNVEYTNKTPLTWKHGSCANVAVGGKRKIYWVCEPSGKGKGEIMVSPIFITEDRARNDESIAPYIHNSKDDAIAACAPLPVEYEGPLIDEYDRVSYLAINNFSFEKDDIEGNDIFNYNESILPSFITTNDNSQQMHNWHEGNKTKKHPELYGDKTAWFDEYIRFRSRSGLLNTSSDDCKSETNYINKYESPRSHLDVFSKNYNLEDAKDLSKLQFNLKWGYNNNNRSKTNNIATLHGFATNDGQIIGSPRRGSETVIDSLYDCSQKCRDNLECKYFTYYPAVSSGFFKGRDKASIYPTNNYPETYHGSNIGGEYHVAASRYYDPFSPYNQKNYNKNPDLFGFYKRGKKHLTGNDAKKMKCNWVTGSDASSPDDSIYNDTNILPVHLMIDRNCSDYDEYSGCRGNILIKKETIPGLNEDLLIPYHFLDNRRDFLNDTGTTYPIKETSKYKELIILKDKLPEMIKQINNKVNETQNKINELTNIKNKEKNTIMKQSYSNDIAELNKELNNYRSEANLKINKNNKIDDDIRYIEQEIIRKNKLLYDKIPSHDLSPFQKYSIDKNGDIYKDKNGNILFYLIPPMIDNVALYRYTESDRYNLNKLIISCDNHDSKSFYWKRADRTIASGNMNQGYCELFNFNTDSPPVHIDNHRKTISGMLTDRKKYTGNKIKYKLYHDDKPNHDNYKQIGKKYLVPSEHG